MPPYLCINALSAKAGGNFTYATNVFCTQEGEPKIQGDLYVPEGFLEKLSGEPGVEVHSIDGLDRMFPIRRFFWEQLNWRKIVERSDGDVLYSSANYGLIVPPKGMSQVLMVQGEISFMPTYKTHVLPLLSVAEKFEYLLRRQLVLATARASDQVFFPSQTALDAVTASSPSIRGRSSVNYLGCRNDLYDVDRTRTWRGDGVLRLLYLSVYYPHKDPGTLARAVKLLNQQGIKATAHISMEEDQFRFWQYGATDLAHLRSGLEDGSITLGRIPYEDLAERLNDFDAVCIPSLAETFGFSLIEGLAAGIPVVATDIPIHREVGSDIPALFEAKNPESLVEALVALDQQPDRRTDMIRRGREWVRSQYDWAAHRHRLLDAVSRVQVPAKAEPVVAEAAVPAVGKVRVLVNGLHAKSGGGITYMRNVLPLLAKDARLDVHVCLASDQIPLFEDILSGVTLHTVRGPMPLWRLLLTEQTGVPRLASRHNMDVIFSPANYGPLLSRRGVILLRNALSVAFVERRIRKLAYWALVYIGTHASILMAKRVASVSRYALTSTIGGGTRAMSDKFSIIPHGVNDMFEPGDFDDRVSTDLLVVSDIYVQKNLHRLIEALPPLVARYPELKLRIAGAPLDRDYHAQLVASVDARGLGGVVEFLGSVPHDRLLPLYRKCGLFIFPSTVETFGNPLVEAMATGAPIACSNAAAMPEIAGDAAVYFDPSDVSAMEDTIADLLANRDKRYGLSQKAVERSAGYAWTKNANAIADLLIDAAHATAA